MSKILIQYTDPHLLDDVIFEYKVFNSASKNEFDVTVRTIVKFSAEFEEERNSFLSRIMDENYDLPEFDDALSKCG